MNENDAWTPVVDVDMLVRCPAQRAWDAFVEPDQICRFWLGNASHRLETGAVSHWTFKVAGAKTRVEVMEALPGKLLDLTWDDGQPLRITFQDRDDGTLVNVRVTDFTGDTRAADAVESVSGFTLVLASLKMWIEHGIEGDLINDKFPDAEYSGRSAGESGT